MRSAGRSWALVLYAEGTFATISELYVRPQARSNGIGAALVCKVQDVARARGWTGLEVATPPLPLFERTFRFYEQQVSISWGAGR